MWRNIKWVDRVFKLWFHKLSSHPPHESLPQDALGREIALTGVGTGLYEPLHPLERTFYYMPLMHSEELEIQKISVERYTRLEKNFPEPP